jgi:hypothetical protein
MSKKLWFKAKKYGWGWVPSRWEGWAVIAVFILFQYENFLRLDRLSHSNSDTLRPFIIETFFAVAVLIFICDKKGEKPGWRWGSSDKK